jgi:hypothetical protein
MSEYESFELMVCGLGLYVNCAAYDELLGGGPLQRRNLSDVGYMHLRT